MINRHSGPRNERKTREFTIVGPPSQLFTSVDLKTMDRSYVRHTLVIHWSYMACMTNVCKGTSHNMHIVWRGS